MTGHAEKAAVEMFGHLSVTIIRATFPPRKAILSWTGPGERHFWGAQARVNVLLDTDEGRS